MDNVSSLEMQGGFVKNNTGLGNKGGGVLI